MNLRRTVFLTLLILAISGGSWGAYYVRERGFTQSWRKLIESEIAKQGYFVDVGRLTLDPFQGLVAQDLRFYQEKKRKTVIAFIDKVILDIDLSQVIDKKVSINTIDFKDADLSLPIDPTDKNSERLQVRRFSARVLMPADKIEIVKAEAQIQGIQISLKGTLLKPVEASPQTEASKSEKATSKSILKKERAQQIELISERRHLFRQILSELDAFDYPSDQPPRIELNINGSLEEIGALRVIGRLSANNLSRSGYSAKKVSALVEADDRSFNLRQFHLQDDKGDLRLRGEWIRSETYVDFDLDSSIDIQSLAQSIHPSPSIGEVVFFNPPQIAIEGRWHFERPIEFPRLPVTAIGSFHCEKFGSRGEVFDSLETDFSLADGKYYLRNLRLDHKSGMAIANAIYDIPNEKFQFESDIKFDITTIAPFMPKEKTRKYLRRWKFDNESGIYLGITGKGPDIKPSNWHMSGPIELHNCRLNGVFFDHIELDFESNDKRQHRYRNLKMSRPDGDASADIITNDLASKQINIENGKWTLPPVTGMHAFSPKLAEKLRPYRFQKPPEINISGHIDARKAEDMGQSKRKHDLDISFSSSEPLDYQFLGKDVKLNKPNGHLTIKDDTLHLTSFTAKTLNGDVAIDYKIVAPDKEKKYTANIEISHIDFRELSRLYSDYESSTGDLTGKALLTGTHHDLKSMNGTVSGKLLNGDIFAVPMLGPFSKIMTDILPRAKPGYSIVKEASADFILKNGIARTDNLEALGTTFKFKSTGSLDLAGNKIDADASFDIRGTAGIILSPVSKVVSKIFEYHADGTISDPQWKAKHIPRILPAMKAIIPGGKDKKTAPETDKPRKRLFNFKKKSSANN